MVLGHFQQFISVDLNRLFFQRPVEQVLRGLFLKGVGFEILWGYGLALLAMGLAFGTFAVLRFQKKLV